MRNQNKIRSIYKSRMKLSKDRTVRNSFQVSMGSLCTFHFFTVKNKTNRLLVRAISEFSNCFFLCLFVSSSCLVLCFFAWLFVFPDYDCENSMNTRTEYFDLDIWIYSIILHWCKSETVLINLPAGPLWSNLFGSHVVHAVKWHQFEKKNSEFLVGFEANDPPWSGLLLLTNQKEHFLLLLHSF